jgi:hypothetical protein
MRAVPASAHAKGSTAKGRDQGGMEMMYRQADMDMMLVSTAPQALPWSSSKTCMDGVRAAARERGRDPPSRESARWPTA